MIGPMMTVMGMASGNPMGGIDMMSQAFFVHDISPHQAQQADLSTEELTVEEVTDRSQDTLHRSTNGSYTNSSGLD
jgi:hypothetical protein